MPNDGRTTLTVAALILALSGLLSRVLAYARDAVIAWQLGAGPETDAYHAAFLLPDMLHYFLAGGALSVTFIPLFSKALVAGKPEDGWRLFSIVLTTIGLVLLAAVIAAWALAPRVTPWLFPGFDEEQLRLTTHLTRLILPGPLFFFAGGLIIATEMSQQRFLAAALSPLIYNACIIAGGLLLGPSIGVEGFSWGVLAGAFAGPVLLPLLLARRQLRYRPIVAPRDPALLRYLALALPLMIGVSLLTVDEWLGRYFGSSYAPGSITWLNNARRLMLVPVALIGGALAQAALPYLARLAAAGENDLLARRLGSTLQATALLSAMATLALLLVAHPFAAFVYERGAFTPDDTRQTAQALMVLTLAIAPWCIQTVAVRGFYAHEDTWPPMWLGTAVVLASLPLYAILGAQWEIRGLAAAAAAGLAVNAGGTLWLYRRRHGASLWRPALRGLAAGLLAGSAGMLGGAGALWLLRLAQPAASGPTWALVQILTAAAGFAPAAIGWLYAVHPELWRGVHEQLPRRLQRVLPPGRKA